MYLRRKTRRRLAILVLLCIAGALKFGNVFRRASMAEQDDEGGMHGHLLHPLMGERAACWREGNVNVLVALLYTQKLHRRLKVKLRENLLALECGSPGYNLHFGIYARMYDTMFVSSRAMLARARNELVDAFLLPEHELVLWLDADVEGLDANLVQQLAQAQARRAQAPSGTGGGVVAPLVLLRQSCRVSKYVNTRTCVPSSVRKRLELEKFGCVDQFYDLCGFIEHGAQVGSAAEVGNKALTDIVGPSKWPPYFDNNSTLVPCESVGTVYMLPASVYRATAAGAEGARHFPTPFTEHYPVVHKAKYERKMAVDTVRDVKVFHACLPEYDLPWHWEDEKIWQPWLKPYLGKLLSDESLREPQPPAFADMRSDLLKVSQAECCKAAKKQLRFVRTDLEKAQFKWSEEKVGIIGGLLIFLCALVSMPLVALLSIYVFMPTAKQQKKAKKAKKAVLRAHTQQEHNQKRGNSRALQSASSAEGRAQATLA